MHTVQGIALGLYVVVMLSVFVFTLVMMWRFVKAVERIARNVEMGARLYKYQIDTNAGNNQSPQKNHE